MRSSRRLLIRFGAAVLLALLVADAATGLHVLPYAAPFLLIAALLLSGRYVGEERILALYRALRRPQRRRAPHWPSLPELPLSAALERAPWSLRGPPAAISLD